MKFILKHFKAVLLILAIVIIVSGFNLMNVSGLKSAEKSAFLLNTFITIKAYGKDANKAVDDCITRIEEIEKSMSAYIKDSEIYKVNHEGYEHDVNISSDTLYVINKGLYYSKLTNGYFDITIKPLVDLWGINTENPKVPDFTQIENTIKSIDYNKVKIDKENKKIRLLDKDMGIDLGGIAKGYAADEVIRIMEEHGIKSAYADLGGNIIVLGKKRLGLGNYISQILKGQKASFYADWKIAIQNPMSDIRGDYVVVVELSDKSIVTSGAYERNFKENGKTYHHILNPFTGYPAETDIMSATIITKKSIDADALSTSIFIMGEDEGLKLIESIDEVEAIVINKDKQVRVTKGLKGKVEVTDDNYKLIERRN